jgi:hypothetical protein
MHAIFGYLFGSRESSLTKQTPDAAKVAVINADERTESDDEYERECEIINRSTYDGFAIYPPRRPKVVEVKVVDTAENTKVLELQASVPAVDKTDLAKELTEKLRATEEEKNTLAAEILALREELKAASNKTTVQGDDEAFKKYQEQIDKKVQSIYNDYEDAEVRAQEIAKKLEEEEERARDIAAKLALEEERSHGLVVTVTTLEDENRVLKDENRDLQLRIETVTRQLEKLQIMQIEGFRCTVPLNQVGANAFAASGVDPLLFSRLLSSDAENLDPNPAGVRRVQKVTVGPALISNSSSGGSPHRR